MLALFDQWSVSGTDIWNYQTSVLKTQELSEGKNGVQFSSC